MEDKKFRVLSFDPGNNLGYSVVEFDYPYFTKAKVLTVGTIDVDKYIKNHFDDDLIYNHSVVAVRSIAVHTNIKTLGEMWNPDFICHETAFARLSVEAFACLRECILSIKVGALLFDRDVKVISINPTTVKFCLMDHKSSDKSEITDAIVNNKEIDLSDIDDDDQEYLDQHSWDAIAIAYTFIKKRVMEVPKIEYLTIGKNAKKRKISRN